MTDDGRTVELATRALLDGVPLAQVREAMARAADFYAPVGVTLTAGYETVSFARDDAAFAVGEVFDEDVPIGPLTFANFVDFRSIHFSTADGAVVRGHAVSLASP